MTILARYLTIRVATHVALVASVFTAVFVAWALATYLSRAAAGLLKPEFVSRLVVIKVVIALDVILPIALYAGVALAAARVRRAGEAIGLLASGFGPASAGLSLTPFLLVVAGAVGVVSLWLRPLSYDRLYDLRARGESAFDLSGLEAGRFYADADGERVVFVETLEDRRMRGVFIWSRQERKDFILHADELTRLDGNESAATLASRGLLVYKREEDRWSLEAQAGSLTTGVDFGHLDPVGYKRKAASSLDLMGSDEPEDLAEFQWRLSRPLSVLLLGFLALRCAGFFAAFRSAFGGAAFVIVVGVAYELVFLAARSLVRDGVVGAWPGIWWVPVVVLVILVLPRKSPGRSGRGRQGIATT